MCDALKTWCDEVADLCWTCYNKLGNSGKPATEREYTVLAAIVLENKTDKSKQLVCLTTGTKCVTENLRDYTIVDCHAESLLKRAFKRHLISRIKYGLPVDNFTVTFFISQLPCGIVQRWKGANKHNVLEDYSAKGINRKPGRGKLCPKPSCINKISKWNLLGLQGKSLIKFTKVIRIDNLLIGNCGKNGEFDELQLINSLRFTDNCQTFNLFDFNHLPKVLFCEKFRHQQFIKTDNENSAAPASIVMWLEGNGQSVVEIVTDGRKHGVTNKNACRHRLLITDYHINEDIELIHSVLNNDDFRDNYQSQWEALKNCSTFKGWTDNYPVFS